MHCSIVTWPKVCAPFRDDDALLPVYGDELDPKLWLFNLCNTLVKDNFVLVLAILWVIWWARRKAIHEHEFQSPLSTRLFIEWYLRELQELPKRHGRRTSCVAPSPRGAAWLPPSLGKVKMNVYAAFAKSSNTGAVGVFGRKIVAFSWERPGLFSNV